MYRRFLLVASSSFMIAVNAMVREFQDASAAARTIIATIESSRLRLAVKCEWAFLAVATEMSELRLLPLAGCQAIVSSAHVCLRLSEIAQHDRES
jgi:hypothetical protein